MKDLLKLIAQALVDHPEQVEVTELAGKQVTILELKVANIMKVESHPYFCVVSR